METGLSINAGISSDSVDTIASGIMAILHAGADSRAEQTTIQQALAVFGSAIRSSPVELRDFFVTGDKANIK